MSEKYAMTIDGQAVDAPGTFGVVDPATGEVAEQAPDASREQLDAAMRSAQAAYAEWRRDEAARRKALHEAADIMFANTEELLPVISFNAKASTADQKKHEDFVARMVDRGYTEKQVRLLSEWYLRVRKSQ
mgnify:CR=1 FL=1